MRKTKLMQITEEFDGQAGYANTRCIDQVVYMICDMAESTFGSSGLEEIAEDVLQTQTGMNNVRALTFLARTFLSNHFQPYLHGIDSAQATEFRGIKPLSNETVADYFEAFMHIEKAARGTPKERATKDLQSLLAGYSTGSAFPICQAIVNFFETTDNSEGLFVLIRSLCLWIKAQAKAEDEDEWDQSV